MAGLLQDFGKPVVLSALVHLRDEVQGELDPEVVRELVEEFHPEVGALLGETWGMPDWLHPVLFYHHAYGEAKEGFEQVRLAFFAERLSHWALSQKEGEAEALMQLPVWADLGIDLVGIRSVLDEVGRILRLAETTF